jgi:hypothetical protein
MTNVRFAPILLKKSKIERLRKSREGQFLTVSAAASLCKAGTKVSDRFLYESMWSLTLPRGTHQAG